MKAVLFLSTVALLAVIVQCRGPKMKKNGVSCNEIETIIKVHNELRKKIANGQEPGQPKASNMQKIVWDDNLANVAQKWANKMHFQHNENRKDSRFSVGENIFMAYGGPADDMSSDWDHAVRDWYSEVEMYSYGPIDDISQTGHYTQTIWADTMYVGCGFTVYEENGTTYKFYVCDYGPSGNYDTEYPYKTGAGCEDLCCKDQCKAPKSAKC